MVESLPIILELARQVPGLLVLVWLVVYFLKHMRSRDELVREIGSQCHSFQRELDEKADARNDKVAKVIDKNTTTIGRLEGILMHGPFATSPQKTQG